MTRFEAALVDLVTFLDERNVPYMVIGGFANIHWGVERFTKVIDITMEVAEENLPGLLAALERSFQITVANPLEFARRNRLIRLQTTTGVDADLILAGLPYESAAIRRAVPVALGARTVSFCSPEDMIVHKLSSERAQDAADVEGIMTRQAGRIDLASLRPLVRDLAAGLERPEIVEFFEKTLRKTGGRTP